MGTARLNGPPAVLAEGACVACLMVAKQNQWAAAQAQIRAVTDDPADRVAYIAWKEPYGAGIRRGDYRAVWAEAPALGLIPLCWDHVAGVDENPSPLVNGGGLPPGLLRGRKGGRG